MQTILDMEPLETPPPKRSRGRAWRVVAIVLALHAVALGGFVVFQGCHRSEPAAPSEDAAASSLPAESSTAPTSDAASSWGQAGVVAQPGSPTLTPEERAPEALPSTPPPAPPHSAETEIAPPVEPSSAPVEAKPAGATIHLVAAGETPASIAKKYGVTAAALMHANHIADASKLRIGQKLVIPSAKLKASAPSPRPAGGAKGARAKSSGGATHVVKAGETLTSIAKRYGVTVNALMKANGITDASKLRIGQKLKLPAGRSPAGGPSTSSDPRRPLRRLLA